MTIKALKHTAFLEVMMQLIGQMLFWLYFDANEEITEQDVRIAGYVHEAGKPSVNHNE